MAQQQQSKGLVLTDGEKLTILIARDGRDISEIATIWGKTRVQIWRYQNAYKLKQVVIKRACEVLGVQESIFDARLNPDSLLSELDSLHSDMDTLKDKLNKITNSLAIQEEANMTMLARVKALEAENHKLKILQN